jgi:hypothetical protein
MTAKLQTPQRLPMAAYVTLKKPFHGIGYAQFACRHENSCNCIIFGVCLQTRGAKKLGVGPFTLPTPGIDLSCQNLGFFINLCRAVIFSARWIRERVEDRAYCLL